MGVQVYWYDDAKTVVCVKLDEGWTWTILYERNEDVTQMMRTTDRPVHLVIDYSSAPTLPMEGVITHARNLLGAHPANCDLRLIITNSMLVLRLVSIFQKTFRANLGKQVFAVRSAEAAVELIRAHEETQRQSA